MVWPEDMGQFNRVDPTERMGHQPRPGWMVSDARSRYYVELKPLDNLNIKGIRDDEPVRRGKKRGGRKPFAIEAHLDHDPDALMRQLSLDRWWVWRRYETASRRDQAYATLVKKEQTNHIPQWGHWEYRKRDD